MFPQTPITLSFENGDEPLNRISLYMQQGNSTATSFHRLKYPHTEDPVQFSELGVKTKLFFQIFINVFTYLREFSTAEGAAAVATGGKSIANTLLDTQSVFIIAMITQKMTIDSFVGSSTLTEIHVTAPNQELNGHQHE